MSLKSFAADFKISSLYLGGEFCRLFHWGMANETEILDVVSSIPDQHNIIAHLFATEQLRVPVANTNDLFTSIEVETTKHPIKIVFQSNSIENYMEDEDIQKWLTEKKVSVDVPIIHNVAGRNFTINALLYSISENKFYDITKQAMYDLKDKRLSTILPANLLLAHKPILILDAFKLSLKHELHIDAELTHSIEPLIPKLNTFINTDRIIKEIVEILTIHPQKGLELLTKFKLDRYLMHPEIKNYL